MVRQYGVINPIGGRGGQDTKGDYPWRLVLMALFPKDFLSHFGNPAELELKLNFKLKLALVPTL